MIRDITLKLYKVKRLGELYPDSYYQFVICAGSELEAIDIVLPKAGYTKLVYNPATRKSTLEQRWTEAKELSVTYLGDACEDILKGTIVSCIFSP